MFMRFCPPLLQLIRNNPTMTMPWYVIKNLKTQPFSPSSDKNIIRGFLNIFDCHLSIFDETWSKGKSEHELRPVLEGIFFYSCIWYQIVLFNQSIKLPGLWEDFAMPN